jgi:hypothetical protein
LAAKDVEFEAAMMEHGFVREHRAGHPLVGFYPILWSNRHKPSFSCCIINDLRSGTVDDGLWQNKPLNSGDHLARPVVVDT